MQEKRKRIRALTLIIITFIVSLYLIRFIIEFSASDSTNIIMILLLQLTGIFVAPFYSIEIANIQISSIVGIMFFIAAAYVISKLLTGLEREKKEEKTAEVIEVAFRIIELLIIFRVLLKFIGIEQTQSPFAFIVYFLTEWTGGFIVPLTLSFGSLEISSLIMLLIVIVLDVNTEFIMRAIKFISRGRLSKPKTDDSKTEVPLEEESKPSEESTPAAEEVQKTPPPQSSPQQIVVNGQNAVPGQTIVINVPVTSSPNNGEPSQIPPTTITIKSEDPQQPPEG